MPSGGALSENTRSFDCVRLTPRFAKDEKFGNSGRALARELAEEFPFVHPVLESLAAVDEDDWDLVGELAAQLFVGVYVDFLPAEQASALELDEAFLDDLAQMTALASVDQDLASVRHARSVAFSRQISIVCRVKM